jgi:hypothetical protein
MGDLGWLIWLAEHKAQMAAAFGEVTAGCVAFCSVLSTALPPATTPGFYANFRKFINTVGGNVGHARNAN